MKRCVLALLLFVVLLSSLPVLADSPIYTEWLWDSAPAVAYNSQDREFLVVWNMYNYLYPPADARFFGPVMGQLMKESGAMVGLPFEIFSAGVLPDVVYNEAKNEYLVVVERSLNSVGQRVSALGLVVGGPTILIENARFPKVAYNSLAQKYLVAGAWPVGSGTCDIQIFTRQVSGNGQPEGSPALIYEEGSESCGYGRKYAVAYAPIVSGNTPQGRYLLARIAADDVYLIMLDSQGLAMNTLCNYGPTNCRPVIPFQHSLVGRALNIDVAYGATGGNPVFFLVWGDTDNEFQGEPWTGIWGGIVDAEKEMYYKEQAVQNDIFPISYQYSHYATDEYAEEWNPAVDYNAEADRFVVVWRETPGTDPRDLTNVNHIRANTSDGYRIPPFQNLAISSTAGSENPKMPCVASSTATGTCLIAWEDHRNLFGIGDIYGSFLNSATRTLSDTQPPESRSERSYWKGVAAGGYHSLGLYYKGALSGSNLMAWGDNDYGQLGLGVQTRRLRPSKVRSYADWTAVVANFRYSLGIRSDGSLWAWGDNFNGQLGLGDQTLRLSPEKVGPYSDWISVAAGGLHSLGFRSDGTLWAWGYNNFGQLGLGDQTLRLSPVKVEPYSDWIAVAAGFWHSLGIRSDGTLWAWGYNYFGQLGLRNQTLRLSPVKVEPYSDWISVAAGGGHSLGIRSDGALWAWGYNYFGQLGLGDQTLRLSPVKVEPYSDWIAIAARGDHCLGIRSDGTLWAWGNNDYGQLGLGDQTRRLSPEKVGSYSDWIAVAAGGTHSLGIRSDGTLWAWGQNSSGQLGLGGTTDRYEPTPVPLPIAAMPYLYLLLFD